MADDAYGDLVRALDDPKQKFYVWLEQDDVLSFVRIEEHAGGLLYIGSFNTAPEARALKVGTVFFEHVLDLVDREYGRPTFGYVMPGHPLRKFYEEMGFRPADEPPDALGWIKIIRQPQRPEGNNQTAR
jgi:GNAT superfamily N-acetyltransferase